VITFIFCQARKSLQRGNLFQVLQLNLGETDICKFYVSILLTFLRLMLKPIELWDYQKMNSTLMKLGGI
jgi:hypothetical protein